MNKIFLIREHKVMLDRELAELYGIKAIPIKERYKKSSYALMTFSKKRN
jgi:hypothetical protein